MNKDIEKNKIELEAHRMMSKMLSEILLNAEHVPEEKKTCIRILDTAEDIHSAVRGIVEKTVMPDNIADKDTLKKVYEYLGMVLVGLNQFSETVKESEESK